jgi:hypothetical protein
MLLKKKMIKPIINENRKFKNKNMESTNNPTPMVESICIEN